MKKILGLDLGTNSIGWAIIKREDNASSDTEPKGEIIAAGSRIIPMDAATLADFDKGNTKSQTAERTRLRLVRRNIERSHLRRERLNRVLNLMGFLPEHYAKCLDRYGKLKDNAEPKIAWVPVLDGSHNEFLFKDAFEEMVVEFKQHHPDLTQIPHDWTLYYLRKKALTKKISKEELAWVLHSFNQKRGYYQLRGEEEEDNKNKEEKYYALRVVKVIDTGDKQGKKTWFDVHLENGFIYHYPAEKAPKWEGKVREFIVTTTLDDNGQPVLNKDGEVKRSFRMPKEEDWGLRKIRTQEQIDNSHLTVGEFIYDTLIKNPQQKIRGEYVRTVDRHYYKEELQQILAKQKELHTEFQDPKLLQECALALYPSNEAHRGNLLKRDMCALLLEDVLFYQRPLKSQKNQIDTCPYEYREFVNKETGEIMKSEINCISRSHPLFQEFRLWQFIGNLRIYERLGHTADGQLRTDVDMTSLYLPDKESYVRLFDFLNSKSSIKQDQLLRFFKLKTDQYRWNYVEDKVYPANETHAMMLTRLKKAEITEDFLTPERETALWHILYSVNDRIELEKALSKFAEKNGVENTAFVDCFKKCPPFDSQYGAYSAKAIKRLLPLMRMGSYWSADAIDAATRERITKIINGECDEKISTRAREKAIALNSLDSYQGLPLWLACYVVYDRHSEAKEVLKWEKPHDIDIFLQNFQQHSLRNPIVEQVVLETLRVVRDIWKDERVGHFDEIHVELGREMKNPADKRKKMTEQNSQNEWTNLRIKTLLTEFMNPEFDIEGVRPHSPSQQEILRIYEDGVLEQQRNNMPEDIETILKKFREVDVKKRPTHNDILRYKLWLEQKYRSPYTGEMISLGKLFTSAYQIEHVIPQSLYFDNSYSNKVICEAEVNLLKSNSLGMQFIEEHKGEKVKCAFGKEVTIFMPEAYQEFVKETYANNPRKLKNLLATELPESFTNRQLNDSRYISKLITTLLSNIVREKDEESGYEDAAVSKNVIVCTGQVTDRLKKDWGFNDVWNSIIYPRFERLNQMEKSERFGHWENKQGKRVFQTDVPLEMQRGFNRKRIDHRHHALDAITIACATRNIVNYLSNQSGLGHDQTSRQDLQHLLCRKQKQDEAGNYRWIMKKPWETVTQDAHQCIANIVVSFKQNLRVVNQTNNRYEHYNAETGKKERTMQTKGDHLAIRKPLHKDTVYGLVNMRKQKAVKLSVALQTPERIVDKAVKLKVKELLQLNYTHKLIEKYFVENKSIWPDLDVKKVQVYYFTNEVEKERMVAVRKPLGPDTKIEDITDSGIQAILSRHLEKCGGKKDIAFAPEGIEQLNANIRDYNNGKFHQPIRFVRLAEPMGQKFAIGTRGCNHDKFVVTAKGTNLFFAVYQKEDGKRVYETIPLNIVIERQKQGLSSAPEKNADGANLLFVLSPNDSVYLPTTEELESSIDFKHLDKNRIYKMVSATGNRCYFIPYQVANTIIDKVEFTQLNKVEFALTGESIKETCFPIKVDRLGNISK